MGKEWSSWEKFNTVEVLTPEQILNLPKDVKVIGTRWVHTDKNQKQRLLALHLRAKTGKSEEQIRREYPLSAKSRLVVQGHQEDPKDIRSDSPTASLLAFNLVCATAVIQGWEVLASDASTAYLQSQGISRLLVLRPPRPPPPGLGPNDLLKTRGVQRRRESMVEEALQDATEARLEDEFHRGGPFYPGRGRKTSGNPDLPRRRPLQRRGRRSLPRNTG